MSWEIRDVSLGTLAAPTSNFNSSTKQFIGVIQSTAPEFFSLLGTTVAVRAVGILQNKPRLGESGEIWLPGCVSKIQCKTAITVGKNFYILGTGLAHSSGSANHGTTLYGPALQTASSGDIITVSFAVVGQAT